MLFRVAFITMFFLVVSCVTQVTWLMFYRAAVVTQKRAADVGTAVFFSLARISTFCVCIAMLYVWLTLVTMQVQSKPAGAPIVLCSDTAASLKDHS